MEGVAQVIRLKADSVSWREVDGEVVVLDLLNSQYLGVNPAGRLLWERLANGASQAELADALVAAFGIEAARAAADVAAFLQDAGRRGLLEQ